MEGAHLRRWALVPKNPVFSNFWTLRVGGPIVNLRRLDPSREQGRHDETRISSLGGHSDRWQRGMLQEQHAMSLGGQGLSAGGGWWRSRRICCRATHGGRNLSILYRSGATGLFGVGSPSDRTVARKPGHRKNGSGTRVLADMAISATRAKDSAVPTGGAMDGRPRSGLSVLWQLR
jgi:hypothetical protein